MSMPYKSPLVQGTCGEWEVVIGLEVHAQAISASKLFSTASTDFGCEPNHNVEFLDAGMPGMLPVINSECVDQAIKTGLGLNAFVNKISVFDRKNYFYPDLPLGYQISQFTHPIVLGGYIDIEVDEETVKRINITRLHLEQDAGKSIHELDPKLTCLDFNRAGVALMEIVSEPDIRSAKEAMSYVKKLRTILRYLKTCDGNMEQGSLRVDANISLHRVGTPFGTRAEIKNVNSIRFLGMAIDYEIGRQMEILEEGGEVVQETRLFDPDRGVTRSMRSKENAQDYRYFADPDLCPLVLSEERIDTIRQSLPELPDAKKQRFMSTYSLSAYDSDVLVAEQETANLYEKIVESSTSPERAKAAKLIANWIIGDVFAMMNKSSLNHLREVPFELTYLARLVDLIMKGTLSSKMAKDVFASMWNDNISPDTIIEREGLIQISDPQIIGAKIDEILTANPAQVLAYRGGKLQLFGFFVGQTLKAFGGRANPEIVHELLKNQLEQDS